jgi:ABC-type lipoprotein export system ATPase subunit
VLASPRRESLAGIIGHHLSNKDNIMLLELHNVSKQFRAMEDDEPLVVLDAVNLSVEHGASISIVGPSGSGKSTLLNIIGALDTPSAGEVLLDGRNIARLSDAELAAVRSQLVGFIFQQHHLLPQCTVLENVLIPTLVMTEGQTSSVAEHRARDLLKRVGLGARLDHRPGQLSGGESQRVAVVRSLINQPKLLLADEPTGALDHKTAEDLGNLLVELNREENVALVVVTHWPELARRMDTVYELQDKTLVRH